MYTFYFIRLKRRQVRPPINWRSYQFKKSFNSIEEAVKFFERERIFCSEDLFVT